MDTTRRRATAFQDMTRKAAAAYWRGDYADVRHILTAMLRHLDDRQLTHNAPREGGHA